MPRCRAGSSPRAPGLIAGPDDRVDRLGWWLRRIACGGRVVVPAEGWHQLIAVVDVRDLAGWLVRMAEQGVPGPVRGVEELPPPPHGLPRPGLPPELEAALLARP